MAGFGGLGRGLCGAVGVSGDGEAGCRKNKLQENPRESGERGKIKYVPETSTLGSSVNLNEHTILLFTLIVEPHDKTRLVG